MNALIDRLRYVQRHPFPQLIPDSSLTQVGRFGAVTGLEVLADDLTEHGTSAAEILNTVRMRVTAATWEVFLKRELLEENIETIASEFKIKKASVYQSTSRVRTLIKQECEAYFRKR